MHNIYNAHNIINNNNWPNKQKKTTKRQQYNIPLKHDLQRASGSVGRRDAIMTSSKTNFMLILPTWILLLKQLDAYSLLAIG